jgi:lysophospholipase
LNPKEIGIIQPEGFPAFPPHWSLELRSVHSSDGEHELAAYRLKNTRNSNGSLLVVFHGFGEYAGRYMHWAHYLNDSVSEIWLLDHLGHGRSQGKRGHTEALNIFTADMDAFLGQALSELRGRKCFTLGHSFGGLLVLKALEEKRANFDAVAGILISSPYLGLKIKVPPTKEFAARLLAKTWSGLSLSSDFDPSVLSKDPHVMEAYQRDRLNHSRMTPGMYREITAAQAHLLKTDVTASVPIGFWVSLDDPLVDAEKSIQFYETHLKGGDREFNGVPGMRHEMMNEIGKEQFFSSIEKWMNAR